MKILLLTQWFDPEPTIKGMTFARELQSHGHSVQVITGFPNYPGGTVYSGYRVRPLSREDIDGILVWRVPLYPSHDRSSLRRAINYGSFAVSAAAAALFVPRPDVAYVYHPPGTIGIPALVLSRVRRIPIVCDIQDLWPDSLRATGMVRNRTVLWLIALLLQLLYKQASHIVVLSSGFRDRLMRLGVPEEKMSVIPNWANEGEEPLPHAIDIDPPEEFDTECFNILFAGNMGRAQDLSTVLEAAEILKDDQGVRFIFVGDGIERSRLVREARQKRLENVHFLRRRPPSEMPALFEAADCLLVHLRKDPLFAITIPSKTQAYMRAGRPILMGVEGDAARLVIDSGSGITFLPSHPKSLAEAVRALRSANHEQLSEMSYKATHFYSRHLSLKTGTCSFLEIFQQVAD